MYSFESLVHLLFEARLLKEIPRSGYIFLGSGKESVAEHTFMVSFIAWVLSFDDPTINLSRLLSMCLFHDLPEARIGDLNSVQKTYVHHDEEKVLDDWVKDFPLGNSIKDLVLEFNQAQTKEAQIAKDADQLALLLELKSTIDIGLKGPESWIPSLVDRLKTEKAKTLSLSILNTHKDEWWLHLLTRNSK